MATNKPRLIITMNEELIALVDDYRFQNGVENRAEAIRRLVQAGLQYVKMNDEAKSLELHEPTSDKPLKKYRRIRDTSAGQSQSTDTPLVQTLRKALSERETMQLIERIARNIDAEIKRTIEAGDKRRKKVSR